MASVAAPAAAPAPPPRSGPRTGGVWRWAVLAVVGIYFAVPFLSALRFALQDQSGGYTFAAFQALPGTQGFADAFGLSARLALVTTVLTLVLMVPTAVYVHLRAPALRRVFDLVTVLPIVIPPVVLIIGVLDVAPSILKSTPYLLALMYVVLAMPFAYRSLDAGLGAIDVRTLFEAARSLGAGPVETLFRVLLPNLRSAVLAAIVLTVALVLGEYTMASLDAYQTFPVWIVYFEQDNSHVSVAASFMALVVTWVVLLVLSAFEGVGRRTRPPEG